MTEIHKGLPVLAFASQAEFEAWLAVQPRTAPGLWLKIAKKSAGVPTVTKSEAIDSVLAYGWIDGQVGAWDEHWFLTRITPRRPKSKWSEVNRDRVEALIAAGRMSPAGQAEVDAAKADGRWDAAYAPQSTMAVPEDLRAALDANPAAAAFFEALDRANRYAVLYRLHEARTPETRARRIGQFVAMLAEGRKIHG